MISSLNSVRMITLNHDNWIRSSCTCSQWAKEYVCKHVVGMALRIDLAKAPSKAKTVPIGQKRKRGRPSNAAKALVYQSQADAKTSRGHSATQR